MGGTGGCRGGDVHFRRRPLEGHAQQVSNVPRCGDGETELEPDVGRDTREDRTDTDTDEHLGRVPVRHFERFLEVFFLQILLEYTRVEVVVHLVVKPSEGTRFDGFQPLGRDRLTVRRFGNGFFG